MHALLFTDWPTGVAVNLETLGGPCIVGSTGEAAILLMEHWPADSGEAFLHALQLCVDVLDDEASADEARLAFLAAAEEAKILIRFH